MLDPQPDPELDHDSQTVLLGLLMTVQLPAVECSFAPCAFAKLQPLAAAAFRWYC